MNRFSAVLAASQTLSMTGFEEASRFGRDAADLDDLLIALVRDDGAGGQALRAAGLTLDGARDAVAAVHAAQLRGIGVDIDAPERRAASPGHAGSLKWSPRAMRVFQTAQSSETFSLEVLRLLIAEPSGFIRDVLHEADVDTRALRDAIDASAIAPVAERQTARGRLRESAATFVPAGPDEVWEWLGSPANVSHWRAVQAEVQPTDEPDVWVAREITRTADGAKVRTKASLHEQELHLVERTRPVLVRWLLSYPNEPRMNAQSVQFELAPATGGTHMTVTVEWIRRARKRSVVGPVLRPLMRWITRVQARSIGHGVAGQFADR